MIDCLSSHLYGAHYSIMAFALLVSWCFVSKKSFDLRSLRRMNRLSCLGPDSFVRFIISIRYSMIFVLKPWCTWASLPGMLIRWNESPVGAGHDWPSVPGNELRAISGCNNQSFLNEQWGSCSQVTRYGWVIYYPWKLNWWGFVSLIIIYFLLDSESQLKLGCTPAWSWKFWAGAQKTPSVGGIPHQQCHRPQCWIQRRAQHASAGTPELERWKHGLWRLRR